MMKTRDISVAVIATEKAFLSLTLHCLQLADINAVVCDPRLDLMASRKVLKKCSHVIVKGHSTDYSLMMKLRLAFHGKIINHWIGSDAYNSLGNPKRLARTKIAQLFVYQNWVVGKRLCEPLSRLGIRAKIVPHQVFISKDNPRKKPTKGILVYNPSHSGRDNVAPYDLYGIDKAVELSKMLPDYTFHLVGGGEIPQGFSSCVSHGYLPGLGSIWDKVDFYFRVTLSDGMPGIILEAAENGILSIADYPYFQGIIIHTNPSEVANCISFMLEQDYQKALEAMTKDIKPIYSVDAVVETYRNSLGYSKA
jgi:hypothetical protein